MANKDNQNQRFIYIRSLKEKVPYTEQQFQEFYHEATRIRKKEQYHHRSKCPKQFIWSCDGDCDNCEHHLGYELLSLDAPNTEYGSTLLESEELATPDFMEEVISDRLLLEQLFSVEMRTFMSYCLISKKPVNTLLFAIYFSFLDIKQTVSTCNS